MTTSLAARDDGDDAVASLHARMARLISRIGAELPPVECPVFHHFSPGVYAREMRVPAGAVVVGKIHKFENMLMMTQGEATFVGGDQPQRVRAPFIWVTPPGIQRAAYAHEDCIFVSVHGTDKRDINEIEAEFIAQNALEYEQFLLENKQGA
jgi:quercetin dioxygenase-like cupin family protein